MKNISVPFTVKGIEDAIRQVEEYRNELNRKVEIYCERLALAGEIVARARIGQSAYGNMITLQSTHTATEMGAQAILIASGTVVESATGEDVNTLLMVEFGAGIRYNATANPKAAEFGMGVGTFPGQTHAFDPNGWYYKDENGEWHHSYGVRATMPMYQASQEIIQRYMEIAREVFG